MSVISGESFTPRTVAIIAVADCQNIKVTKKKKLVDKASARIGLTFVNKEQYDRTVEKEEFKTWLKGVSRYSFVVPEESLVSLYTTTELASDILHGLSLLGIPVEDKRETSRRCFHVEINEFKPFTRNKHF